MNAPFFQFTKSLHFPLAGEVGQLRKRKRVLCWFIYVISSWRMWYRWRTMCWPSWWLPASPWPSGWSSSSTGPSGTWYNYNESDLACYIMPRSPTRCTLGILQTESDSAYCRSSQSLTGCTVLVSGVCVKSDFAYFRSVRSWCRLVLFFANIRN